MEDDIYCCGCKRKCNLNEVNEFFDFNEKKNQLYKQCKICKEKQFRRREKKNERNREYAKEQYYLRREEFLEKQRKYKEQHREQINEKVECDVCGSIVSKHGMARHKKTDKCQKKGNN